MKIWALRSGGTVLSISVAAMTLAGGSALAADIWPSDLPTEVSLKDSAPIAEPDLWQGLYVGGHAGGGWTTATVDDHYEYHGDPRAVNERSGVGAIAGGQIGYNFRWGNIVFGPEAELGYLGLSGSKSAALPASPECSESSAWQPCGLEGRYSASGGLYGDITGRVGYALDQTLIYAKGGVAFLNADIKAKYLGENCSMQGGCGVSAPVNASTFSFEKSETLVGWTAGAGVEYALTQEWSVKVEYQHFDFGVTSFEHDADYHILGMPDEYQSTLRGKAEVSNTVDTIKVGLNFRMGASFGLE